MMIDQQNLSGKLAVIKSANNKFSYVSDYVIVNGVIHEGWVINGCWDYKTYPDLRCKVDWLTDNLVEGHYNEVIEDAECQYLAQTGQ